MSVASIRADIITAWTTDPGGLVDPSGTLPVDELGQLGNLAHGVAVELDRIENLGLGEEDSPTFAGLTVTDLLSVASGAVEVNAAENDVDFVVKYDGVTAISIDGASGRWTTGVIMDSGITGSFSHCSVLVGDYTDTGTYSNGPLVQAYSRESDPGAEVVLFSAPFGGVANVPTTFWYFECIRSGGLRIGGIRGSGDGATVTFEGFTGSHTGAVDSGTVRDWVRGALVCTTGTVDENHPRAELTTTARDPRVVGAFLAVEEPAPEEQRLVEDARGRPLRGADPAAHPEARARTVRRGDPGYGPGHVRTADGRPAAMYAAVGVGAVLVNDTGGSAGAGDLVCSSEHPGEAMAQGDDLVRSYTAAKLTEDVDWSRIRPQPDGRRLALVACVLLCG